MSDRRQAFAPEKWRNLPDPFARLGRPGRMKAQAIRRYRCICEECEPLPPIDGLSATRSEEPSGQAQRACLGKLRYGWRAARETMTHEKGRLEAALSDQ
jgi:hypothetical protein